MLKHIITHLLALYIGAGLSLGLIMNQVLPLSHFGVAVYTATWPRHVYCVASDCFGAEDYLPMWFAQWIFDLDESSS